MGISLKVLLLIVLSVCLAVLVRYGFAYRATAKQCNDNYQSSLDTLTAQSQTVLADHYGGCSASFTLLTDWELCLVQAEASVPVKLRPMIQPWVTNIMLFFREKIKDIAVLKKEHDQRCAGYTPLLFYPPDAE